MCVCERVCVSGGRGGGGSPGRPGSSPRSTCRIFGQQRTYRSQPPPAGWWCRTPGQAVTAQPWPTWLSPATSSGCCRPRALPQARLGATSTAGARRRPPDRAARVGRLGRMRSCGHRGTTLGWRMGRRRAGGELQATGKQGGQWRTARGGWCQAAWPRARLQSGPKKSRQSRSTWMRRWRPGPSGPPGWGWGCQHTTRSA